MSARYTDAAHWARLSGVVYGISSTGFNPASPITREQLAAMLYRYAKYKGYDATASGGLSGFPDTGTVPGWAEESMNRIVGAGIIIVDGTAWLPLPSPPGPRSPRYSCASVKA